MTKYVDASHNLLYTLDQDKWLADLQKSDLGDVTGYQEVSNTQARSALRSYCKTTGRGLFHPTGCTVPISWRTSVFKPMTRSDRSLLRDVVKVHASATTMGVDAKLNPAREFTYVGLTHKESGKKILRINVHPIAGGTKKESDPTNTDSDELSVWKDWGIGQYWLDVIAFAARQMSRQNPGAKTMANFWDAVTLGGDYNGSMENQDRWYYPGTMLPTLFVADKTMTGLDHLQHAHGSDVKAGKRWSVSGNTDHRIHYVERTFLTVPDFPRQR
jgi:hypothetical protein